MEARTILLTTLVLALTSSTTGQDFCVGKADGPYCEHCWQPVQCTAGVTTVYSLCQEGMACTVDFGTSFCTLHTETDCACTGAGDQCDAYNSGYIEHCDASGPFLVASCPAETPTCYNGECREQPACIPNDWNLTPDCAGAFFCDINGVIQGGFKCEDGEFVNSEFECAPTPVPACDGSCTGLCPNPVDCTKYFICQGTTPMASGDCAADTFFDIDANECRSADYTCTFLDGCDFEVGLGTTTTEGITTACYGITTAGITTTTHMGGYTVPPATTCNSSTVGSKYPFGPCSKQFYMCAEPVNGQYQYIVATCPGDLFFNTDPNIPYCTPRDDIDTCQ